MKYHYELVLVEPDGTEDVIDYTADVTFTPGDEIDRTWVVESVEAPKHWHDREARLVCRRSST